MDVSEAISLCWRTMPLRGLGPRGARVGHSVCIVRQVLGSSKREVFYKRKDDGYIVYGIKILCMLVYMYLKLFMFCISCSSVLNISAMLESECLSFERKLET